MYGTGSPGASSAASPQTVRASSRMIRKSSVPAAEDAPRLLHQELRVHRRAARVLRAPRPARPAATTPPCARLLRQLQRGRAREGLHPLPAQLALLRRAGEQLGRRPASPGCAGRRRGRRGGPGPGPAAGRPAPPGGRSRTCRGSAASGRARARPGGYRPRRGAAPTGRRSRDEHAQRDAGTNRISMDPLSPDAAPRRRAASDGDPARRTTLGPMSDSTPHSFETLAIHAGNTADPLTGAVVPPIYQVSTYKQDGVGGLRGGYEYSRSANPTRTALEENLAALEGGRRGLAFASGLAAEDCLLRTLLTPGDHVVIPNDAYGGTFRLFAKVVARWGVEWSVADTSDPAAVRAALTPQHQGRSGWRPPPTRCSASPTSPPSPRSRRSAGRAARRRQHLRHAPTSSSRSRSARTSSCTPPPSTWAATRTSSAARWSSATRSWARSWRSTRTRWARSPGRSTPGWCCAASRPSPSAWTGTARTPPGSPSC